MVGVRAGASLPGPTTQGGAGAPRADIACERAGVLGPLVEDGERLAEQWSGGAGA